jgi:hypothetical protein
MALERECRVPMRHLNDSCTVLAAFAIEKPLSLHHVRKISNSKFASLKLLQCLRDLPICACNRHRIEFRRIDARWAKAF